MKRFLPFAVLMVAAACTDRAAPFAPTTESESVLMASRIASAKADKAAKASKVDVCHVDDMGKYKLINVSANALKAHLGHGDGLPGVGDLGADCSSVVVVEPFSFDGPVTQVGGQLFWTVIGTPSAVSFLIQNQLPSDPPSPTPGEWVTLATVTGTGPGSYQSEIPYANGTYRIVAIFAVGSPVESSVLNF